jgi:hypothetical protein
MVYTRDLKSLAFTGLWVRVPPSAPIHPMSFTRIIENFTCEHCGTAVAGNGYTNHCPQCLWSKHVDVEPGDRAATCGGMMRPVHISFVGGEYIITHGCEKCGYKKNNKSAPEDSTDRIAAIMKDSAEHGAI